MTDRPPLSAVLEAMAASGRLTQMNITRTGDGRYQVSLQRDYNTSAWGISIKPTIVEALYAALGPDPGWTWAEHLGFGGPTAQRKRVVTNPEDLI